MRMITTRIVMSTRVIFKFWPLALHFPTVDPQDDDPMKNTTKM